MSRHPVAWLTTIFALHLGVLAAYGHLHPKRMQIRGIDAVAYYSYFHSVYFDRDFNFRNQYDLLGEGHLSYVETKTGRTGNVFSVGPSVALVPMLLAADVWARVVGTPADGLSSCYHVAAFLGLTAYGLTALLLMAFWCGWHFGRGAGGWAALLGWGGTTLMYYSAPMDFMPHAIGAAGAVLFLLACDRTGAERPFGGFVVGLALGMAMLARWQNALYVIYPIVLIGQRWLDAEDRRLQLMKELRWGGLLVAGGMAGFAPQLAAWKLLYGTTVLVPQGEGFLEFLRPSVHPVLFSMERGLFTWTPLTMVAVLGLVAARGEKRVRATALALVFLVQLYLNSTVLDRDGSWGFGMRRFTEMAPAFAFGLAAMLTRWDRREWREAFIGACLLFVVWNELFIFQYVGHLISWDAPLTWHEYAGDKFHLASSFRRRLCHNEAQRKLAAGRPDEALAWIAEARSHDAQHDDILILEAVIHESKGDYVRAEELLLEAREMRPSNPHLVYLLRRVRGSGSPAADAG